MNPDELDEIRQTLRVDQLDWMTVDEALEKVVEAVLATGCFLSADSPSPFQLADGRTGLLTRVYFPGETRIEFITIRGPVR